jgi:hypothetical protein
MSNLILPNHLPGIVLAEDNWDKKPDAFVKKVLDGKKGLSVGFANGLDRINRFLYGTHRARYYLIGADSGVGKTTLCDFMYVMSLWMDAKLKGIPIRIVYLSFEISSEQKIARWVSLFIKFLYDRDIPADYIMGRITGMLINDQDEFMIRHAKQYVDTFLQDCELIDGAAHPTWILNHMVKMYEGDKDLGTKGLGTVVRDKPKNKKDPGFIRSFTPHDPRLMTVLVCDHVALAHPEAHATTLKAIIDKLSNYAVMLRNTFGTTIVFLQQFATDLMSTHRASKKGDAVIAPQRIDFGDSKYTYRDADVVMGLVAPMMFDHETYKKYDIGQLMQYFLACHLMKNRYGPAGWMIPLFINPIAGTFKELPTDPLNGLIMQPWYDEVSRLNKVIDIYQPKAA